MTGKLHLFGRTAASLLAGRLNAHFLETSAAGAIVTVNVNESRIQTVPVLELAAGVSWTSDCWQITAGYEFTQWTNLAVDREFLDDVNEGKVLGVARDLSLDGFTARLGAAW